MEKPLRPSEKYSGVLPQNQQMAELQGQMPKHPVADKENSTLCFELSATSLGALFSPAIGLVACIRTSRTYEDPKAILIKRPGSQLKSMTY